MASQSHYLKSHTVGDFYGKYLKFWAGFGPVGNTEKKVFGRL
jgi:hypothetical protein